MRYLDSSDDENDFREGNGLGVTDSIAKASQII